MLKSWISSSPDMANMCCLRPPFRTAALVLWLTPFAFCWWRQCYSLDVAAVATSRHRQLTAED